MSAEATEQSRTNSREAYQNLDNEEKKAWIERSRKIRREAQDRSLRTATKIRFPWTQEEIVYLEENGTSKTILEIATELERTYHGVRRFAEKNQIPLRLE